MFRAKRWGNLTPADERVLIRWRGIVERGENIPDDEKHQGNHILSASLVDDVNTSPHWQNVRFLIENDCVNYSGPEILTALIKASSKGEYDIVYLMLTKEGIDINAADSEGGVAIEAAFQKKQWVVVESLLKSSKLKFTKNQLPERILLQAAREAQWNIVDLLLTDKIQTDPNAKNVPLYTQNIPHSFFDKVAIRNYPGHDLHHYLQRISQYDPNIRVAYDKDSKAIISLLKSMISKDAAEREKAKFIIEKLDDKSKEVYMPRIINFFALNGNEADVKWCVNQNVAFTLRARDISFKKIENAEVKEYLAKIGLIAELKHECEVYHAYLRSKHIKRVAAHPVVFPQGASGVAEYKDTLILQKKSAVAKLVETLRYNNPDNSLENFKHQFENLKSKDLSAFSSPKVKIAFEKFIKIMKAIITGGVYAIVRGKALESHQFWKTARQSFDDKTKKHIENHHKKGLGSKKS